MFKQGWSGKKFVIYDNAIPVRSVALVDVMFYPRGQVERDIIRDKGELACQAKTPALFPR